MEMQELLAQINALAKKKREEGLTDEEQKRQKELYAIYLKGFRAQVKGHLSRRYGQEPQGRDEEKSIRNAHDVRS